MSELGYRPNLSARSLRSGRTGLLSLLIPHLTSAYFAELAHLIIAAAAERDYTVLIEETDGVRERELHALTGAAPRLTDGVIISPLALESGDLTQLCQQLPMVLLGERDAHADVDHVAIDNHAAARDAARHLIAIGRTRVDIVGVQTDPNAATSQLRFQGATEALRAAGLKHSTPIPVAEFSREEGMRVVDGLLSRERMPDALLCFNDELAIGAIRRLRDQGWNVPADIAVIGIDDVTDSRYLIPSLTSIAPDKAFLSEQAVGCLLSRLTDGPCTPRDLVVPHQLVVRERTRRG